MKRSKPEYICRVCGYQYDTPFESTDICICCFCEADYDDRYLEDVRKYRQKWIEAGYPWTDDKFPAPDGWNAEEQMKNIPHEWLQIFLFWIDYVYCESNTHDLIF